MSEKRAGRKARPVPIGHKFGAYTVIGPAPTRGPYNKRWMCRCDCGVEKSIQAGTLTAGLCAKECKHGYAPKPERNQAIAARDGEIYRMYTGGAKVEDIVKITGVPRHTVYRAIKLEKAQK